MSGERLERIARFGVVILEEEIADFIVEGIVEAAFALEGVSFAKGAGFEEDLDDFEVAA